MKKLFKLFALLLAVVGATSTMQAQGEAELGKQISFGTPAVPYLTFTPAEDGILSATVAPPLQIIDGQAPSSLLYYTFKGDGSVDYPYEGRTVPMKLVQTSGINVTQVSWEVEGGRTYYLYKNTAIVVTLSFEAGEISGGGGSNVIIEDEPFTAYNRQMIYTPEKNGLLTIETTVGYTLDWYGSAGAGLLFTDEDMDNKVQLYSENPDAAQVVYTCTVEGNKTYYFFNSARSNCVFTFILSDLPVPALTDVTPTAGIAFDATGDYGSGVYLGFNPTEVTFETATITYTPKNATEPETVTLDNSGGVGEDGDFEYEPGLGSWKFRAVSRYYELAQAGTNVTLTLTGTNYLNIPVQNNETGVEGAVTVDNGTVTVYWAKPGSAMSITEQSWPEVIYRNSVLGDPNMIATITFSQALSTLYKPSASFVFGSQTYGAGSGGENEDPGAALNPSRVSVNGNVLTVNLSGINFGAYADQQPLEDYSKITIFVGNIFAADGQKFNEDNPGIRQVINYNDTESDDVTYLPDPSFEFDADPMYPNAYVYWDTTIDWIEEGSHMLEITVPGGEVVDNIMAIGFYYPGAQEGDTGYATDNAIVIPMGELISEYGDGLYSFSIGTLVMDADKAVNKPYSKSFSVGELPTLYPGEAQVSYNENQITVTWGTTGVKIYDANLSILIYNSMDPEDEVSIPVTDVMIQNNSTIVINLEELGLDEETTYQLEIPQFAFYVVGNQCNDAVLESFIYGSSGVATIGAEILNGNAIYRLDGTKVSSQTLKPGIYIINGKKVMVK